MASPRDLLQRFRPAGAPGAATAAGVPADRVEEREAELAPVFQQLAGAVAEAEQIRRDARVEAERRRQAAREAAAAQVAAARLDAEAIRTQILAEAHRESEAEARAGADRARLAAQELLDEARRTLDTDVAEVLARVRSALVT